MSLSPQMMPTEEPTPDESMAESFDTDAEDSLDEQVVEQGRDNSKDGTIIAMKVMRRPMMIPSFWYERMTAPITLVLMTS
jgi:hypothetical protein